MDLVPNKERADDPMLLHAKELLEKIMDTNSLVECVATEIEIRKLEQALKKEVETGRTPRGSLARVGRDYTKILELLSRASAAAVTHISVEHDKDEAHRMKREKMLEEQRRRRRAGLR